MNHNPPSANTPRFYVPLRIIQVFVGFILLITAVGKLLDNRGFAAVLDTYHTFNPAYSLALGLTVSLVELFLAGWLFRGTQAIFTACISLLMHLAYTLWSYYHVTHGLQIDNCGCFGVFWARPLGMATVYEDLVMSVFCAILLWLCLRDRKYCTSAIRKV